MSYLLDWQRERSIRQTLSKLSRQRLVVVLPSGDWVIEKGLPDNEETWKNLITCHMRGWVEVLREGVPFKHIGGANPVEAIMSGPAFTSKKNIYRLTEGGWAVLNRSHGWVLATFIVSTVSLAATVHLGVTDATTNTTSAGVAPATIAKLPPAVSAK